MDKIWSRYINSLAFCLQSICKANCVGKFAIIMPDLKSLYLLSQEGIKLFYLMEQMFDFMIVESKQEFSIVSLKGFWIILFNSKKIETFINGPVDTVQLYV